MIKGAVPSFIDCVLRSKLPKRMKFLPYTKPATTYVGLSMPCKGFSMSIDDSTMNQILILFSWSLRGIYETYHEQYDFQQPQLIYMPPVSNREGTISVKIGIRLKDQKMEKKPKLGSGKRFEKLEKSIAEKGNVSDPEAVAAAIGRKKYGAVKMAKLSSAARKRNEK